jgi:hypothetical protein
MVLSGPLIDVESFSRITADMVDRGDVRNAKLNARQMYPSCKKGSDSNREIVTQTSGVRMQYKPEYELE